jgi:hypothetical protein
VSKEQDERDGDRALVYAGMMPLAEYVKKYNDEPLGDYQRLHGRIPKFRLVVEHLDGSIWHGPNERVIEAMDRFHAVLEEGHKTKSIRIEEVKSALPESFRLADDRRENG